MGLWWRRRGMRSGWWGTRLWSSEIIGIWIVDRRWRRKRWRWPLPGPHWSVLGRPCKEMGTWKYTGRKHRKSDRMTPHLGSNNNPCPPARRVCFFFRNIQMETKAQGLRAVLSDETGKEETSRWVGWSFRWLHFSADKHRHTDSKNRYRQQDDNDFTTPTHKTPLPTRPKKKTTTFLSRFPSRQRNTITYTRFSPSSRSVPLDVQKTVFNSAESTTCTQDETAEQARARDVTAAGARQKLK